MGMSREFQESVSRKFKGFLKYINSISKNFLQKFSFSRIFFFAKCQKNCFFFNINCFFNIIYFYSRTAS